VNLKGRENEFRNNAIELLRRFQNDVGEVLMMYFFFVYAQNNIQSTGRLICYIF
jgi:hypothetical protein